MRLPLGRRVGQEKLRCKKKEQRETGSVKWQQREDVVKGEGREDVGVAGVVVKGRRRRVGEGSGKQQQEVKGKEGEKKGATEGGGKRLQI